MWILTKKKSNAGKAYSRDGREGVIIVIFVKF